MFRSRAYLDAARGQPCTLRTPVCVGGTDTTVACHGWLNSGQGIKTDSIEVCDGCHTCHAYLDRRLKHDGALISGQDRIFYFHRGMVRTLLNRLERGILAVK